MRSFLICYLLETDIENILFGSEWITPGVRRDPSECISSMASGWRRKSPQSSFRDAVVVLTRMTGYEEEDILEYLENSFQSPIWNGAILPCFSSGIEG